MLLGWEIIEDHDLISRLGKILAAQSNCWSLLLTARRALDNSVLWRASNGPPTHLLFFFLALQDVNAYPLSASLSMLEITFGRVRGLFDSLKFLVSHLQRVQSRTDLGLKQLTSFLEHHLLDPHAEGLTQLLRVLGNHVVVAVVKSRVEGDLVQVTLDFLQKID